MSSSESDLACCNPQQNILHACQAEGVGRLVYVSSYNAGAPLEGHSGCMIKRHFTVLCLQHFCTTIPCSHARTRQVSPSHSVTLGCSPAEIASLHPFLGFTFLGCVPLLGLYLFWVCVFFVFVPFFERRHAIWS